MSLRHPIEQQAGFWEFSSTASTASLNRYTFSKRQSYCYVHSRLSSKLAFENSGRQLVLYHWLATNSQKVRALLSLYVYIYFGMIIYVSYDMYSSWYDMYSSWYDTYSSWHSHMTCDYVSTYDHLCIMQVMVHDAHICIKRVIHSSYRFSKSPRTFVIVRIRIFRYTHLCMIQVMVRDAHICINWVIHV